MALMSRRKKNWLLFYSLLPTISFIGIFVVMFGSAFAFADWDAPYGQEPEMSWRGLFTLYLGSFGMMGVFFISYIAISIYFVVHAFNDKSLDTSQRIIWAVLLLMAGFFMPIVYYFVRIHHDQKEPPPLPAVPGSTAGHDGNTINI